MALAVLHLLFYPPIVSLPLFLEFPVLSILLLSLPWLLATALSWLAMFLHHTRLSALRKFLGLLASVIVLYSPIPKDPISSSLIRIIYAASAMKYVDVAVLRKKPIMQGNPLQTFADKIVWTNTLWSQVRYESFDIAVHKHPRESISWSEIIAFYIIAFCPGPFSSYRFLLFTLPTLVLIVDFPRYILWRKSPPIFSSIWKTTSMSEMWGNSWHQLFNSSFKSIGYHPVSRYFGRVPAVFSVFFISALFHIYAFFPVFGWRGGWRFFIFFFAQGCYCIVENLPSVPVVLRKWAWCFWGFGGVLWLFNGLNDDKLALKAERGY